MNQITHCLRLVLALAASLAAADVGCAESPLLRGGVQQNEVGGRSGSPICGEVSTGPYAGRYKRVAPSGFVRGVPRCVAPNRKWKKLGNDRGWCCYHTYDPRRRSVDDEPNPRTSQPADPPQSYPPPDGGPLEGGVDTSEPSEGTVPIPPGGYDPCANPVPPPGCKGMKRVPEPPPNPESPPASITLIEAVDDCFAKSVPNYRSPDWSRFDPTSLRRNGDGQFAESFIVSGVAAEQALKLDELVYGKWNDRELMHDYLVGWLTHCLTDRKVLPMQDPRQLYARFLRTRDSALLHNAKRRDERWDSFFYGYWSYPLPPFRDQDRAGPPSPPR